MIFTNVIRYSVSAKKIRAQAVLQDVLLSAVITDNTATKRINIGEFGIEQEFKPYPANNALTEVHLTAFDDNQQKVAEVVISMLITAIVIAITYTSYSIISKSYGAFNDKNKMMADYALLDHLLRRDVAQAAFIQKDAEGNR
eukprot:gene17339-17530_t